MTSGWHTVFILKGTLREDMAPADGSRRVQNPRRWKGNAVFAREEVQAYLAVGFPDGS